MRHQWIEAGERLTCKECGRMVNPRAVDVDTFPEDCGSAFSRANGGTAVVVISHNYGRFLAEALDSVLAQTLRAAEILVIDDASEDGTGEVAGRYADRGVKYLRVANRSVYLNRLRGLDETSAPYLVFLDADDMLPMDYLEKAEAVIAKDLRVGIVCTDFELVGLQTGKHSLPSREIEHSNYIHCASLVRRSAITSIDLRRDDAARFAHEDWYLWRQITRAGWKVGRSPAALLYRRHGDSMMDRNSYPYRQGANLDLETVQIVLPLSGRAQWFPRLRDWVEKQTWPAISVLVADNGPRGEWRDGVKAWLASLPFETGYIPLQESAGLADKERRNQAETIKAVQVAMPRIYNQIRRRLAQEYVMWVEDDVLPPVDAISRLMDGMAQDVACVSGLVRSRFDGGRPIEWSGPDMATRDGRGEGLQQTYGTGFGCLLVRRSFLAAEPLHSGGRTGNYDQEVSIGVERAGLRWMIDWSVGCHHQDIGPEGLAVRS